MSEYSESEGFKGREKIVAKLLKAADFWESELEKAAQNSGPPKHDGPLALASNMLMEIYRVL